MMEVQWVGTECPAGRSSRKTKPVENFVATLQTRPGVWAVFKTLPAGKRWCGYNKYRGRYPNTDWATKTTANVTTVFACWLGEESQHGNA